MHPKVHRRILVGSFRSAVSVTSFISLIIALGKDYVRWVLAQPDYAVRLSFVIGWPIFLLAAVRLIAYHLNRQYPVPKKSGANP